MEINSIYFSVVGEIKLNLDVQIREVINLEKNGKMLMYVVVGNTKLQLAIQIRKVVNLVNAFVYDMAVSIYEYLWRSAQLHSSI